MSSRFTDVCVIGDGPAGVATALRLAECGRRVLMLHRTSPTPRWGGESFTGAIRNPLTQLGAWTRFLTAGHVAGYECRTTWGSQAREDNSLFRRDGHLWHVDRARFDNDLRALARERKVSMATYRTLDQVRYDEAHATWTVQVDSTTVHQAAVLVDATGRRRALARRLGVHAHPYDRLIGYTVVLPRNTNPEYAHTMVLEAMSDGWWYAAPVPAGHVLAFFTDYDLVPKTLPSTMKAVNANSAYAQSPPGTAWITVGDACAAHDPLCGWGVHRALSNGIRAADAIDHDLRRGSTDALDDYRQYCRQQFDTYLDGLITNYRLENRWGTPFWRRRTARDFLFA